MFRYGDNRSALGCHFLKEVAKLCREHGYEIGHEDTHGAFIITKQTNPDTSWFDAAVEETPERHDHTS